MPDNKKQKNKFLNKDISFGRIKLREKAVFTKNLAIMLITDPQGRRFGKDPVNNIIYEEIPGAFYTEEPTILTTEEELDPEDIHYSKIIYIEEPDSGEYKVEVIGTGEGNYTLSFNALGQNLESSFGLETGEIITGVTQEYSLAYDPENIEDIEIEIIDEEAPEASIYFDSEQEKIIIKGTDNITQEPIVTEEKICVKKTWKKCLKYEYVYTVSDEAGNTLKLWINKTELKRKVIARIKKIQYNDSEKINTRASAIYIWNKNLKMLSQTVTSYKDFIIEALYKKHKDNTKIWGYDWEENRRIKETKEGLNIIKLNTNQGELEYEY